MRELFYYYYLVRNFIEINFSKKLYFFSVLRSGVRKEAFSESCSLIGGVVLSDAVLSLVKICKKYIEVNHSLLLICSLKK